MIFSLSILQVSAEEIEISGGIQGYEFLHAFKYSTVKRNYSISSKSPDKTEMPEFESKVMVKLEDYLPSISYIYLFKNNKSDYLIFSLPELIDKKKEGEFRQDNINSPLIILSNYKYSYFSDNGCVIKYSIDKIISINIDNCSLRSIRDKNSEFISLMRNIEYSKIPIFIKDSIIEIENKDLGHSLLFGMNNYDLSNGETYNMCFYRYFLLHSSPSYSKYLSDSAKDFYSTDLVYYKYFENYFVSLLTMNYVSNNILRYFLDYKNENCTQINNQKNGD